MRTTYPKRHEPTKTKKTHLVGKMGRFRCPVCGRTTWQHLGYMPNHFLTCNHEHIHKNANG